MIRYVYSALCYLSVPFVLSRLLWRSRKNSAYRQRWSERFGFLPDNIPQHCLWVHSVSVGETIAAVSLVKSFQKLHPDVPVVMTTMTINGAKQVTTSFGQSVYHVYVPYDLPTAVTRFINRVQPKMLLIMETELWPNLLHITAQRKIPIFLANARMSERSAARYAKFKNIVQEMMLNLTKVAVQTQIEADRFISLGLPIDRIQVTGTVKFDIEVADEIIQRGKQLRVQIGSDRPVWITASTHAGEEEIILATFNLIKKQFPHLLLILVPRHPERAKDVATLCRKANYKIALFTEQQAVTSDIDIYLTDAIGQLMVQYVASDIAFVGGSLVPTGGHNVLEPAVLGLPVITGPEMFNFVESTNLLMHAGALWQITNAEQLTNRVIELLKNPTQREQAGKAGQQVIEKNRGAVQKHMQLIESLFNSTMTSVNIKKMDIEVEKIGG
jgi:3-deoxy-D-manno-octulosonic-acid transferase